ncbi:MAG TPA: hypothetical protein VMP86_07685, partial [Candidatus Binatia bacterium]|nr:hypothetical protein [Candidatus Binatia bacterium]
AAPSTAETHDLSRFTDVGEFPNDAEQVLLDRLPAALADACDRADLDDRPGQLPIRAGVSCLKDGVRVHYWQQSDSGDLTSGVGATAADLLFGIVIRLSLTEGSCQTASRVYQAWDAGLHSGYVICYVSADGDATMQWTFDGPGIYAVASRRGAQTRELYEWWVETGRRLGR